MEQRKRPEPLKEYLVNDLGNGIINITWYINNPPYYRFV